MLDCMRQRGTASLRPGWSDNVNRCCPAASPSPLLSLTDLGTSSGRERYVATLPLQLLSSQAIVNTSKYVRARLKA